MRTMKRGLSTLAVLLVAATPALADRCSEALAAGDPVAVFDHEGGGPSAYSLRLGDGDQFWVKILRTDEAAFTYNMAAVELVSGVRSRAAATEVCLTAVHDEKYGGYVVRITKRDGAHTPLDNTVLMVTVKSSDYGYDISGGFPISGLTDPVYTLDVEGAVRRNLEAEDSARLGFGGFVTAYHSQHDWVGASFGLGLDTDGAVRYYVGPSFRLGDTAAITGGVVWGPVARLPNDVTEGDLLADIRLLDMKSRIAAEPFFAISFSFVGWGGEELSKPFAGE
jgi:hypothetical protein